MSLASTYIRTKKDLSVALQKNYKKLPADSASCMTKRYLVGVWKGKYWVPRYNEV